MKFELLERRALLTTIPITAFDPVTGAEVAPAKAVPTVDFNGDRIADLILMVQSSDPAQDYVSIVFGGSEVAGPITVRRSGVVNDKGLMSGVSVGNGDVFFFREFPQVDLTTPLEIVGIADVNPSCDGQRIELALTDGRSHSFFLLHHSVIQNADESTFVVTSHDRFCPGGFRFDFNVDGIEDSFRIGQSGANIDLSRFTLANYSLGPIDIEECCENEDFRLAGNGLGDLNADGLLDIVIGGSEVLLNTATGFEVVQDPLSLEVPDAFPEVRWIEFDRDDAPGIRYSIDVDDDGVADSLLLDQERRTIQVYLDQDLHPVFEFPSPESALSSQGSLSTKDVNGDGISDVILHTPGYFSRLSRIYLYWGIGDGTFALALSVPRTGQQYFVGASNLGSVGSSEVVIFSDRIGARVESVVSIYGLDLSGPGQIVGDADSNGVVTLADFESLASNFGQQQDAVFAEGDFNSDGAVSFEDYLLLSANVRRG